MQKLSQEQHRHDRVQSEFVRHLQVPVVRSQMICSREKNIEIVAYQDKAMVQKTQLQLATQE